MERHPKQLAKDNKKFQYSIVRKGGRSSQYIGSLQWLEDAGIAKRCYNTQITELPLEGNSMKMTFDVNKRYTYLNRADILTWPEKYICSGISVVLGWITDEAGDEDWCGPHRP